MPASMRPLCLLLSGYHSTLSAFTLSPVIASALVQADLLPAWLISFLYCYYLAITPPRPHLSRMALSPVIAHHVALRITSFSLRPLSHCFPYARQLLQNIFIYDSNCCVKLGANVAQCRRAGKGSTSYPKWDVSGIASACFCATHQIGKRSRTMA